MLNKTLNPNKPLEQRILILDGAMGTMIQNINSPRLDFRGERFKESAVDFTWQYDLLTLTQPLLISAIHENIFTSGRRYY